MTCPVVERHSKFLHIATGNEQTNEVVSAASNVTSVQPEVYLPIVNVRVNGVVDTQAVLDTASDSTFCSRELVHELESMATRLSIH